MSWKAILFGVVFGLMGYAWGRHDGWQGVMPVVAKCTALVESQSATITTCTTELKTSIAQIDESLKTANDAVQQFERCQRARL